MKKFAFRLARVQRLRERVREQREQSLAEALQYQGRVEAQIEHMRDVRAGELDRLRAELSHREVSVQEAIQARTYESLLGRFSAQLNEQLRQVKAVVEQRRLQLMEAEKSVRILEKLEEKQHRRYDQTLDLEERQLMDELALVADQRRRQGEY